MNEDAIALNMVRAGREKFDRRLGWTACAKELPEAGIVVDTKIDDMSGVRNEQQLKRSDGRLWFLPDGSMYVYYEPTHWRPVSRRDK